MTGKLRIGVLLGGRSGEHEVSLMSARSVLAVLDPAKYAVTQIGITHQGEWVTGEDVLGALQQGRADTLTRVTLLPQPGAHWLYAIQPGDCGEQLNPLTELDVIFPVLHGSFGEDGTLQGLLEMANIAYVGAGVLGSALGMDKAVFKDVMRTCGVPVLNSVTVTRQQIRQGLNDVIAAAEQMSAYPLFTKPANLGSSVGITRCRGRADLVEGLQEAARYDRRILVEQGLDHAREIEVSVLGNEQPQVSVPGEILPCDDFYSYEAKYLDDRSRLVIPADLPAEVMAQIQTYALTAYQAVDCAGMARADFLLEPKTLAIYLNEINTIPGFTQISMYPKLWQASGLPYPALVDRLIELALERKAENDLTEREYRRAA